MNPSIKFNANLKSWTPYTLSLNMHLVPIVYATTQRTTRAKSFSDSFFAPSYYFATNIRVFVIKKLTNINVLSDYNNLCFHHYYNNNRDNLTYVTIKPSLLIY